MTTTSQKCNAVLDCIVSMKHGGISDDEGEAIMGWRHQCYSPRRRDLVLLGLIRKTGERRKTRSGGMADVWVPNDGPEMISA